MIDPEKFIIDHVHCRQCGKEVEVRLISVPVISGAPASARRNEQVTVEHVCEVW